MASKKLSGLVGVLLLFVLTLGGGIGGVLAVSAQQEGTPAPTLSCIDAGQVDPVAQTVALTADCVTEASLSIPDGWTFEGDRHTIFVKDPAGARFHGGVILVNGLTATVRNVIIDGSMLEQGCSAETGVSGILFYGGAGAVERSKIANISRGLGDNCGYGILVFGSNPAPVRISSNTIEGVGEYGIVVHQRDADLHENVIHDAGRHGIVFGGEGASGLIDGNAIRNAGHTGIRVEDMGVATLAGNDVVDAQRFGIAVTNGSTVDIVQENRIYKGQVGMVISDAGTTVTIDDNTVTSTTVAGIVIQSEAHAFVKNTVIDLSASSGAGITVSQAGSRAEITDSIVTAAMEPAILVQDGAYAKVDGNSVHGPEGDSAADFFGPYGIRFTGGAQGVISGNRVYGYASNPPESIACAISVEAKDGPVTVEGNTFPEPSTIFPTPNDGAGICYGPPGMALAA